jgi:DNA-binding HxlR family transcriptional regulator
MPATNPGRQLRRSQTERPIMALLDLLSRRWALRVMWELREDAASFRDLQSRCDSMSPSVLNDRLSELREAGIVERVPAGGYRLTEEGHALGRSLLHMNDWAKRWERREANRRRARDR